MDYFGFLRENPMIDMGAVDIGDHLLHLFSTRLQEHNSVFSNEGWVWPQCRSLWKTKESSSPMSLLDSVSLHQAAGIFSVVAVSQELHLVVSMMTVHAKLADREPLLDVTLLYYGYLGEILNNQFMRNTAGGVLNHCMQGEMTGRVAQYHRSVRPIGIRYLKPGQPTELFDLSKLRGNPGAG